jgi:hypothetical protein
MDRRRFLLSAAATLGIPGVTFARGNAVAGDKNLIVVIAVGGWDVTFCFDPKLSCSQPDGSACFIEGPEVDQVQADPDDREAVQTFGNIPVVVNPVKRPAVAEFFEAWHPHSHVVNGIWTGSIAHDPCRYRLLTGTPDGTKPDLATITGFTNGGSRPLGSVDLSGWSISGPLAASSGRVGHNSQIKTLLDPDTHFNAPPARPYSYPLFQPDGSDASAIDAYVAERAATLRARFGGMGGRTDQSLDHLVDSLDRSQRFASQASGILDSLKLGQESKFLDQLDMAVDLIDQQVCRAVTVDTTYDWDTHDINDLQHGFFNGLFSGLSHLMEQLEAKGLLENTVVAVISEMTRTPLRNASTGKDHWGHTSAMLLGAVQGNRVSGATDHYLESQTVDLATGEPDEAGDYNKYDNFCAGLLELVDVDPEEWLPAVTPFRGAHPS